MAALEVVPATAEERLTIENLFQLYAYDWSDVLGLDVGDDGRFRQVQLDVYWRDGACHPFLIRVDGRPGGFALVCGRSRLSGADGVFDMAEFFVMRRHRRQGIGRKVACALFERFEGRWEIRQRLEHPAATNFWRDVIARHTGGKYREVMWDDAHWRGPVQTFSTI
ncbi:MAG: GNAT family N-acetyltransferase [Pseudomonadota bacterium]